MSNLQKKIGLIGKSERPTMGFARATREQPRQMLLAVIAPDAAGAAKAIEAGADVAIINGKDATAAVAGLSEVSKGKSIGAQLDKLAGADAKVLKEAGCDFVISPLETTESAAFDSDAMGQIVPIKIDVDDTTLRAIGPMNFDALLVQVDAKGLTLANQLGIVRLATMGSTTLMVAVDSSASTEELRVLRDSGVSVVIAPEKSSADQLAALSESLKAVPPPRKSRREGNDIALVPAASAGKAEEEDDEDDDDE